MNKLDQLWRKFIDDDQLDKAEFQKLSDKFSKLDRPHMADYCMERYRRCTVIQSLEDELEKERVTL